MKKLLVCTIFMVVSAHAFTQGLEARILEVQGKVEARGKEGTEWKPLAAGDTIGADMTIATGFRSTALVALGSSRIAVQPLTMLTVEELAERSLADEIGLLLQTGKVRVDVKPPEERAVNFTLRSPVGTAAVRGTSFEFDGSHLRVYEGTVLLLNNGRQSGYVGAGRQGYIDVGNQNRVIPPFEAETAALTPRLPELGRTGGGPDQPAAAASLASPNGPPAPGVAVDVSWE